MADGGDVAVTGAGAVIKLGNGQNLTADALDISTAGASLSLSGTGNTASANTVTLSSISLGEGSGFSLKAGTSNVTVTAGGLTLANNAAISLEAGQVLDLSAVTDMDDDNSARFAQLLGAVSGAGTLKLNMDGQVRMQTSDMELNTNAEAARLELNAWNNNNRSLIINEDASLTLTGSLIIQSTAKVVVDGGDVDVEKVELGHSQAGNPGHIILNSGSITTQGFVHYNSENTITIKDGTLDITTSTGISNGIGLTMTGGTLVASDAAGWGVTGASVGGAAVSAGSTGSVTLTNPTITGNVAGNGKLLLKGTVNAMVNAAVSGAVVGIGDGVLGVGSVSIQGSETLTLIDADIANTIVNTRGKLALSGTVNILSSGYFTLAPKVQWSADNVNGYRSESTRYALTSVVGNLDTTQVSAWQVDGSSAGVSYSDGDVLLSGGVDTTTYWVNTGTVLYSNADTKFDAATTTLKLNGNTADGTDTLQLNTSLKKGVSIIAADGSVTKLNLNGASAVLDASQLGEGVSASTVTLTGDGKYTQAASGNAISLKVGGVTDAANWTGTVTVSGRVNGLDLDALGNANSWVELKGVSGYLLPSDVINTNVRLTDNGSNPAVNIMSDGGDSTVTFNGQVEGEGTFMRDSCQGGVHTYVFAGDVSGWNGVFSSGTDSATTVKFSGSSTVNADVSKGGNASYALHVVLDDSSMATPTAVQMNGDIEASTLTVTEGTTAKINGTLSLDGALTTNGVTQLSGDAANGITLGQIAGTGTLEILQGDVTVNRKTDFGSGTLKLAAGSTLNLDLSTLGVSDLKNWTDAPLLMLGTLDTLAAGGMLNVSALVSEAALLTLGNGDSAVLATITNCSADLSDLLVNEETAIELTGAEGMKYEYKLVKEDETGVVNVVISATNAQEGWIAEDTDADSLADTTWTDVDIAGDGKWAGAVGEFYGQGSAAVNVEEDGVTTDNVIVSAAYGVSEYTFTGGTVDAAILAVNKGTLVLDNAGVTASQAVILAQDGALTVQEGKTLTVGEEQTQDDSLDPGMSMGAGMSVGGESVLVNKGTTTVNGTLSIASTATVNNSGTLDADMLDASGVTITNTGTLISGGGVVGTLAGEGILVNRGVLNVETAATLAALINTGTLYLGDENLTVKSSVTSGGTVVAGIVEVDGTAAFTSVTADKLTAEAAALKDAVLTTLDSSDLTLTGGGIVKVTDALALNALSGTGTLKVDDTLTLNAAASGAVKAETPELVIFSTGNELSAVSADEVTMAEGLMLSTTEALLTVDSVSSLHGDCVSISVSTTAFDALERKADGVYSVADYLLICGADSAESFKYVNEEQLAAIRKTGVDAALAVKDGTLSLSIFEITDEHGNVVGMVWDTTDGNTTTNNGVEISTGAGFYKSLDYVNQVVVTENITFDLSADAVGDSVAGNASNPEFGLLIRNLSGGGELIIKGGGVAEDTATVFTTSGDTVADSDAVSLTADAVKVNLGLPPGTEGFLESDMDSEAPTLAALRLLNAAQVMVNGSAEVLGDTDVADGTTLRVRDGSILTTGMLSGTEEAVVGGSIIVTGGGVYSGGYDEASITAAAGSKLRLHTGGSTGGLGLNVSNGGQVTLDFAGQDGTMDYLRVGEPPVARFMLRRMGGNPGMAELNLLNTSLEDGAIYHSTVTLDEETGNYINKAAVSLSLGAAETARSLNLPGKTPLVIDGTVDVTDSSITVNMLGDTMKNGVLEVNTDADRDLTLARLVTGGNVEGNTVTLTGTPEMLSLINKYYTNARLSEDGAIKVDRVADYYGSRLNVSENAHVGIRMADTALVKLNPQANRAAYKDMADVLDALDAAVQVGDSSSADELGAAVSGASVAALGAAVAGDVERQLMGIRNRTTTMGVDQTQVNQSMPYFNAWINAEGDFRRMDEDGTSAGYELSSWGGTVGFDVDVTPRFTMGLAATAMYGNFTAESADKAEGDLDTYYVTAFARYASNRWSHTFVATAGMADTSLRRTVSHAAGNYTAEGDTEATVFGFLYELGYVVAMNESATACLQPVFNVMLTHSSLDGYTEENSDAALKTGGVDMTTVTFGLGVRAQAIVGTNLYNRSSMVEARALLKVRAGDRSAESDNELAAVPGAGGCVSSAEIGTIGAELGAGITVPLGSDGGSVFADASLEVGGGYTNINGTVGYRINF